MLNVLFAAVIGGFALGQAAPNLQYFAQAKAAGGRVFELMARQPAIDPDAPGQLQGAARGPGRGGLGESESLGTRSGAAFGCGGFHLLGWEASG